MKKALIILAVVATVLVATYLIVRYKKAKQIENPSSPDKPSSTPSGSSGSSTSVPLVLDKSKLLKKGVKGAEVEQLQKWLNANINSARNGDSVGVMSSLGLNTGLIASLEHLAIDGVFGENTEYYLQIITMRKEVTLNDIA